MAKMLTFYLSRALGRKIFLPDGSVLGKIKDFLVDFEMTKPKIIALKTIINKKEIYIDIARIEVSKRNGQYMFLCKKFVEYSIPANGDYLDLKENFLDRQLVDINGRKLVRVNDIRIAIVQSGMFTVAVDVGMEGLLRRIGVAKPIRFVLKPLSVNIPSKFILWDDVEAVDFTNFNVRLTKSSVKLKTLHPSDLADIIENLGKSARETLFGSLDEEHAADVLEELVPKAQAEMIDTLTIARAADILEKMPADEAADLLEELEDDKAEALLNEMEKEASDEVRELLEYEDDEIGSIMNNDFVCFYPENTVAEALEKIKIDKPESQSLYSLFIIDKKERFVSALTLRDLILAEPSDTLKSIMPKKVIFVHNTDKIDTLAEITSKYNLLAIPVVDQNNVLEGMVVIDDIVEDLLGKKKTA